MYIIKRTTFDWRCNLHLKQKYFIFKKQFLWWLIMPQNVRKIKIPILYCCQHKMLVVSEIFIPFTSFRQLNFPTKFLNGRRRFRLPNMHASCVASSTMITSWEKALLCDTIFNSEKLHRIIDRFGVSHHHHFTKRWKLFIHLWIESIFGGEQTMISWIACHWGVGGYVNDLSKTVLNNCKNKHFPIHDAVSCSQHRFPHN